MTKTQVIVFDVNASPLGGSGKGLPYEKALREAEQALEHRINIQGLTLIRVYERDVVNKSEKGDYLESKHQLVAWVTGENS